MTKKTLTHLDARGAAHMVDVGDKAITAREATAVAIVSTTRDVIAMLKDGTTPKGDVLAAVRLAGIAGAKRTSELVPLCHAIAIDAVSIDITLGDEAVRIVSTAGTHARTGVEMEALVAASVAALTLYDMLKSVDRAMVIREVRLVHKSGGRSGTFSRDKVRDERAPRRSRRARG